MNTVDKQSYRKSFHRMTVAAFALTLIVTQTLVAGPERKQKAIPTGAFVLPKLESRESFTEEWNYLSSAQAALKQKYQSQYTEGFHPTPSQLYRIIEDTLKTFTPGERALILAGKELELPQAQAERALELEKTVNRARDTEAEFQDEFDKLNNRYENFFIRKWATLLDGVEKLPQRKELAPLLQEAKEKIADYHRTAPFYGTENDDMPRTAVREFVTSKNAYLKAMNYGAIRAKLIPMEKKIKQILGNASYQVAGLMLTDPESDFLHDFKPVLNYMAKKKGLAVEVSGLKNIPKIDRTKTPNRVNILFGTHNGGELDAIGVANIAPPRTAIITSGYTWAPKFTADRMAAHNQFIVVAHETSDPTQKIKDLVKEGKIDNVVLLGEGARPSGVTYANRINKPNVFRFLGLLTGRRVGLDLNLVPMTFTRNQRLHLDPTYRVPGDSPTLSFRVHEAIPSAAYDYLDSKDDRKKPTYLTRFTRAQFLQAMHEDNPGRLAGQPTFQTLWTAQHDYMRKNQICDIKALLQ